MMQEIYERLSKEKRIIGICGKKRSGKDTAANALMDMKYRTAAFADPIKDVCQTVFRFSGNQLFGPDKEKTDPFWGFSPRWAMQQIGSELFRKEIDQDIWIKSLLQKIDSSNHPKWAITDVRLPNEIDRLEKAGADIIHIRRPETEPKLNPVKKKIAKYAEYSDSWKMVKKVAELFTEFGTEYHSSEILFEDHPSIDSPDIINDGTIAEFEKAIHFYVKKIEEGDKHFQDVTQLISSSIEKYEFNGKKVHGANIKC